MLLVENRTIIYFEHLFDVTTTPFRLNDKCVIRTVISLTLFNTEIIARHFLIIENYYIF
jgi:hypothetical protein